jgi:hypothetical protein
MLLELELPYPSIPLPHPSQSREGQGRGTYLLRGRVISLGQAGLLSQAVRLYLKHSRSCAYRHLVVELHPEAEDVQARVPPSLTDLSPVTGLAADHPFFSSPPPPPRGERKDCLPSGHLVTVPQAVNLGPTSLSAEWLVVSGFRTSPQFDGIARQPSHTPL